MRLLPDPEHRLPRTARVPTRRFASGPSITNEGCYRLCGQVQEGRRNLTAEGRDWSRGVAQRHLLRNVHYNFRTEVSSAKEISALEWTRLVWWQRSRWVPSTGGDRGPEKMPPAEVQKTGGRSRNRRQPNRPLNSSLTSPNAARTEHGPRSGTGPGAPRTDAMMTAIRPEVLATIPEEPVGGAYSSVGGPRVHCAAAETLPPEAQCRLRPASAGPAPSQIRSILESR